MKIKVLGPGCPKCKKLEKSVNEVVAEFFPDAEVEKIEDVMKIMEYGVMSTPALVADEKVLVSGRVPSAKEIKKLLEE